MTRPAMPKSAPDGVLRDGYDTGGFYDEAFEHGSDGVAVPRAHYAELIAQIASMDGPDLRRAAELANRSFLDRGGSELAIHAMRMRAKYRRLLPEG